MPKTTLQDCGGWVLVETKLNNDNNKNHSININPKNNNSNGILKKCQINSY